VNEALRIILPLYLLAYLVVAFLWRSYLVYKRTGVNPYVIGRSKGVAGFVEMFLRVPLVVLALVTFVYAVFPGVYQFAVPIHWLESFAIQVAGVVLLGVALVWTAIAQMQMGKSWRVGIDKENRTELVESGLFKISRNPIFLGLRVALVGFFLAMPNAVTLLVMTLSDVLMQIQVRLEEEFLTGVHGDKYQEFCSRVRRWI